MNSLALGPTMVMFAKVGTGSPATAETTTWMSPCGPVPGMTWPKSATLGLKVIDGVAASNPAGPVFGLAAVNGWLAVAAETGVDVASPATSAAVTANAARERGPITSACR